MPRWGLRMFEGDRDREIVVELNQDYQIKIYGETQSNNDILEANRGQGKPVKHVTAADLAKARPDLSNLSLGIPDVTTRVCGELDTGLGNDLFDKFRGKEHEESGQYRVIILGATLMRAGARIRPEDMQHMRELVPGIACNTGSGTLITDDGFCHPGKVQFICALDNYQPGIPLNFAVSSCYNCGKTKTDTGRHLEPCTACMFAGYCNWGCASAHWEAHQRSCRPQASSQ
ncbi:hypothetical protein BJ170DRAFT_459781 [Xylariales sp. AK1849]|nr:hypothetical protein BJ170DRAFT_459781 [Xylariales sp. AK1849]